MSRLPTDRSLRALFAGAEDGFVQIIPRSDHRGEIVDGELIAWNLVCAVEIEMRLGRRLDAGTLLSDYAFNLKLTLEHIAEAMATGRSVQFLLGFDVRVGVEIGGTQRRLLWQRVGDTVIGQLTDLSEYQHLQELLADQQTLAALAVRARTLAEDRERIARNLHDTVIQNLYAAALELEFLAMDGSPIPEREQLAGIGRNLQSLIEEIRVQIFDVKRSIETGLREELLDVILPMAGSFGVSVEVDTEFGSIEDPDLAQNVRAVVRESASNAIRHGHATRVLVKVSRRGGRLVLEISDNGIGIDSAATAIIEDRVEERAQEWDDDRADAMSCNTPGSKFGGSSGLVNMRRRAKSCGGSFDVAHRRGGGTVVTWTAPLNGASMSMVDRLAARRSVRAFKLLVGAGSR